MYLEYANIRRNPKNEGIFRVLIKLIGQFKGLINLHYHVKKNYYFLSVYRHYHLIQLIILKY